MAFSRNSVAAAVAGTLSLAALTGCPAPTTTQPSASPSAAPTAGTPSAAPTAGTPSAAPTTAASGEPTVAPSVTPSASTLAPTTVQGKVYAEDGSLVSTGAKVMIKSLNPSNPFETTIDVVNGNYVANNVPAGVLVEVTAMRDNWTPRVQVATLLPLNTASQGNTVDFGGKANPYFISKYPEVTSVEPADEATLADSSMLTYKLTLSEPLDADNRNRFASALRVWPANTNAAATNVGNLNGDTYDGTITAGVSSAQEGTPFLTASNVASVTWDAAGKVATFSFKAPLKASKDGKARYAVGLAGSGLSAVIQDSENNQLGQVTTGNDAGSTFGSYTSQAVISNVFKKPDLPTLSNETLTGAVRWAQTHDNVAEFDVAEDDTAPTLASVTITGRNIFTLTFSEPMAAAAGSTVSSSTADTTKYRFAIADSESEVGSDSAIDDATSADSITTLASATDESKVYTFAASAFEAVVDENDAKIIRIRRKNILTDSTAAADKLNATSVKYVRFKVLGTVMDPAGNAVTTSNDASIKNVTL